MLQWPLVSRTAESSSSKGYSAGQRERETHLHVTRKIVISLPVRQGGEINQTSLGCSLGTDFHRDTGIVLLLNLRPQPWEVTHSELRTCRVYLLAQSTQRLSDSSYSSKPLIPGERIGRRQHP